METFTLGEKFDELTTIEQQLLARAIKNAVYYGKTSPFVKKRSKKTSFICNHYDINVLPALRHLLHHTRAHFNKTGRPWLYEHEKCDLIKNHFLAAFGVDPEGFLVE